jgi:hypothetical protein
MKIKLTAAQCKAGVDLRDVLRDVLGHKANKPAKKVKPVGKAKHVPLALPSHFGGAELVRGKGMNADELDEFVMRKAFDQFYANHDIWLVLENNALEDGGFNEPRAFKTKEEAVRYAQAQANGNVDQRVLRVTEQVLVIATENEL